MNINTGTEICQQKKVMFDGKLTIILVQG